MTGTWEQIEQLRKNVMGMPKTERTMPRKVRDCPRDDCRIQVGPTSSTCVYYPPIYNKYGENTNPDKNRRSTPHECLSCGDTWIEVVN